MVDVLRATGVPRVIPNGEPGADWVTLVLRDRDTRTLRRPVRQTEGDRNCLLTWSARLPARATSFPDDESRRFGACRDRLVHTPLLPPGGGEENPHRNEEDYDSKRMHPSSIGGSSLPLKRAGRFPTRAAHYRLTRTARMTCN